MKNIIAYSFILFFAGIRDVYKRQDLNRQVCAVGTTVMRAIESTVSTDGHLKEYEGWTNKFIRCV